MSNAHDMRDSLDALSVNIAWQQMVVELRERQDAIIRALVAETTAPDERDHLATEYRMIQTFVEWPAEYRSELDGLIREGRE